MTYIECEFIYVFEYTNIFVYSCICIYSSEYEYTNMRMHIVTNWLFVYSYNRTFVSGLVFTLLRILAYYSTINIIWNSIGKFDCTDYESIMCGIDSIVRFRGGGIKRWRCRSSSTSTPALASRSGAAGAPRLGLSMKLHVMIPTSSPWSRGKLSVSVCKTTKMSR